MKKWLRFVASGAIGVILVAGWLKFIDVGQMLGFLKQTNIFYLSLSLVFYLLAYLIRSARWRTFLRPLSQISLKKTFDIFMAGMLLNYLIPVRAGEVAKGFFLKSQNGTPVSKSLPTVFVDKMMDLTPVILLILLLPIMPIKKNATITSLLWLISIIFLGLLTVITLAVTFQNTTQKILRGFFFWLPKKYRVRMNRFIKAFVAGLSVIKQNYKNAPLIGLLTGLAVLCDTIYIIFMFLAFGYKISFLTALFGYTLINLSYILPTPPAQLGSNEAIYIIIFTFAFGIDKNLVSAALGSAHLITGTLIFVVGIYAVYQLNLNLRSVLKFQFRDQN